MTTRTACAMSLFIALYLATPPAVAQAHIWLEGENPASTNYDTEPAGWGNTEYLSEGLWLSINIPEGEIEQQVPDEGILLKYEFDAPAAGDYQVWGRVGFEFVRAPFDWRIDDGPWDTIDPREDLSTDLMEIDRWNEVAWVHMGDVRLEAGEHALTTRLSRRYRGEGEDRSPQRIIYTADAFCLYPGEFRPNGKHEPGSDYQDAEDRRAAERVIDLEPLPPPGQRARTDLSGLWQIARYDETWVEDRTGPIAQTSPADELHWYGIEVPGNRDALRPEMKFCHRYFYRTRVRLPETLAGRRLLLDVDEINMLATVFVNGQRVAFHDAPVTGFVADITDAARPGEINEVWVGIKDTYYAIEPTEDQPNCRYWFNIPTDDMDRNQGVTMRFDYPVKGQIRNGILDQVQLVVTGPAYASDVFAIPSVENGELGLEIEVTNPGDEPLTVSIGNEVVPLDGGPAAKTFEAADLVVPAGEVARLSLAEPFPNARLWWPDDPYQYEVVTTLRSGDRVLDTRRTKFGFRQWTIQGTRFVLNGIPWQLRANLDYYGASHGEEDEAVAAWAETGQNMFRLRFQSEWAGMTQNQALDFFDQAGVPVRKTCSTFDGQHASYRLVDWVEEDGERRKVPNAALFENWRNQIRHRVRQMRNHPSIFVWELDNEIIYINTRNFGNLDVVEPEFTRASEMILEMDPSGRGVMVAGGRALMDQSLPINGGHYEASPLRDYPDMSYGLGEWTSTARHQVWPMAYDKPIFLSEEYFASGPNPDWFAAVGGEVCFLGRAETRDACGLIGEMYSEGYRWQELGGFHYWTSKSNGASYYESWQPVLALCREWNWSFASGAQVSRTVMVRNDTRLDTPIDLEWEVTTSGGERVAGETLTLQIPPGEGEITEISFGLPEVTDRTAGTLSFICHRDGEEVWSEANALSILPPSSPPAAGDQSIVVLDPDGAVIDRLAAAGTELAQVATLEEVPDEFDLLIVGRDALTAREATDPRWLAWASEGRRVLVLEQETPLHYQAVPADFEPTDYVGRVAFPENLEHPVFEGLAMEDFFTWSGDHVVYRNPYRKASRGARSLAQCDESLSCSALAQCPVDDGLLLLCQMVVGEKLDTDPVAQRLFDNMVAYGLGYERVRRHTAVVMDPSDPRADMIASTGLEYTPVGDPVAALSDEGNDIVIVDASPGSLADLAAASDQVRSFTDRGGWLMLWGVTPEGLEAFNEIVRVDHLMRPFRMEKVALKAPRDPLTSGLSQRDVVLYSGERIFGWTADEWLADDVFSYVVDLDEVAPFAEGDAIEGSSSVVNAMTSVDAWKYIYYMPMNEDGSPQTATWRLPRAETITGFSVVPNPHYWYLTRIKLVFDGDEATAQVLDLDDYTADANPRQDFELTPVTASQVTLVPLEWRENPGQAILGLDNIWLHVERPEDFHSGVKALTNIGALVKYPRGEGGIVLNQLLAKESETVPINAEKKRNVFATLMANLGAVFAGGEEALTTANLSYEPISLEGLCNLYITSEGGWPGGERDLSRLPLGEQRMAGVTYEIRDFETSPLEHAITLQGLGGIDAPASVTIPVGQAADALFFLHTWWRHGNDPPRGDEEAPIVFEYVVHYEDGRSVVVPVQHGRGVAHWVTDEPKGLRDAMVAWEAPLEGTDERAVLYSMQWTNPDPESVIDSVELRYNPDVGGRWGAPVLLAVTAAQERE